MLRRLYVHNYRCFENFELLLGDAPSSLLIGGNGTGKSTVGFALEVLQRVARGTNRVGDLVKRGDFSQGRSSVPIRFEVESTLMGQDFRFVLALDLPENFRELRVLEESLTAGGREIYSRNEANVSLTGGGTRGPVPR